MEVAKVCIDTSVLIDLLRNKSETVDFLRGLESRRVLFATTTINAFELFYGAYRSKKRDIALPSVKGLLRGLVLLAMNGETAELAGRTLVELEARGESIELRDLFTGCMAKVRGYGIVTRNVKHFEKIHALAVVQAP